MPTSVYCSMVPFDRTKCICDFCLCFQTYASEGRFTFTSHSAGEHEICLHSNSSAWFASGQLVNIYYLLFYILGHLSTVSLQ